MKKINWRKLKPINGKILIKLHKNQRSSESKIIDVQKNRTRATIIRCANDVIHEALLLNSEILIRKMNDARLNQTCIDREESIYLIDESRVIGVFREGTLFPIGRKYLLKRIIETEKLASGIIIPYGIQSKDQTMWCEFVAFGITNLKDRFKNQLIARGDRVVLESWKETHVELGNMSGGYFLIVNEDDVCYVEYHTEESEPKVIG